MPTAIGIIRVLTTQDEELLNAHGRILKKRFPNLKAISRCIPDQPEGIFNEETSAAAVPKIIILGREMMKLSIEALIVSCADDPGVQELRREVRIPVVGAGSACAGLALTMGARIATMGIRDEAPGCMKRVLADHLVGQARPEGVHNTLHLLKEEGKRNAFKAAANMKAKGADVIALACTGFSTIGIAPELETTVGIPVIDAVEAAGLVAEFLVKKG